MIWNIGWANHLKKESQPLIIWGRGVRLGFCIWKNRCFFRFSDVSRPGFRNVKNRFRKNPAASVYFPTGLFCRRCIVTCCSDRKTPYARIKPDSTESYWKKWKVRIKTQTFFQIGKNIFTASVSDMIKKSVWNRPGFSIKNSPYASDLTPRPPSLRGQGE